MFSNKQVQSLLGQGSLSPNGYGNPEGLDSRESKSCRDLSKGDWISVLLTYKGKKFELLIDKQDEDIIAKGVYVLRTRQKSGLLYFRPVASKNGFYRRHSDMRLVHILVAEKVLRRPLKKIEVVHHINGNPFDARRCNLIVMKQSEHARLHSLMGTLFAQLVFQSPLDGVKLQLLNKLLSRKTQATRGLLQVIGPGKEYIVGEEIVQSYSKEWGEFDHRHWSS